MLERRRARITWALGLIVVLCSYNLAYANVKFGENTNVPPATVRTTELDDVGNTRSVITDSGPTTVTSSKKNVSTVKNSAKGANSCACSCSSKTGRATAAPGRWWDCMKGCLRSWGVSPIQLALCGTSCASGVIPVCAVCLALNASVFILCATGCAVYSEGLGSIDDDYQPILVRKLPLNKKQKAQRLAPALAALK